MFIYGSTAPGNSWTVDLESTVGLQNHQRFETGMIGVCGKLNAS